MTERFITVPKVTDPNRSLHVSPCNSWRTATSPGTSKRSVWLAGSSCKLTVPAFSLRARANRDVSSSCAFPPAKLGTLLTAQALDAALRLEEMQQMAVPQVTSSKTAPTAIPAPSPAVRVVPCGAALDVAIEVDVVGEVLLFVEVDAMRDVDGVVLVPVRVEVDELATTVLPPPSVSFSVGGPAVPFTVFSPSMTVGGNVPFILESVKRSE